MKNSLLKEIVNFAVITAAVFYIGDKLKDNDYSVTKLVDSYDRKHKLGVYDEKVDSRNTKTTTTESKNTEKPKSKTTVYVHGLGDYNTSDLQIICDGIENFYGYTAVISEDIDNVDNSFFLDGTNYLKAVDVLTLGENKTNGFHMYVTNYPICRNTTYTHLISGYARYYHTSSVVSTYQMTQNGNYGVNSLQHTANHELAHNLGIEHCDDENCLMKAEGLDTKDFCNNCKRKLYQ